MNLDEPSLVIPHIKLSPARQVKRNLACLQKVFPVSAHRQFYEVNKSR